MSELPTVQHHYLSHHLDSKRWEAFEPRGDDVIVTTSYKCGTTFTQQILYNLLVEDTADMEVFPNLMEASPWVDARFHGFSLELLKQLLAGFERRRFLKSHLPLDGLPYHAQVKYLIVARDARDVFMSLLNHYGSYTDQMYEMLNDDPGLEPMPRYNGDDHALWRRWISTGWFDWEQEGSPFWSNMRHTQSYWDYRHLPNFMFIHYEDMIADTPAAVGKIANFIEHEIDEAGVERVAQAVNFKTVKAQAVTQSSREDHMAFKGGQATFINKGTNGRWREFLSEEELAMYTETRDRVLSPDCASWLENGGELPG